MSRKFKDMSLIEFLGIVKIEDKTKEELIDYIWNLKIELQEREIECIEYFREICKTKEMQGVL